MNAKNNICVSAIAAASLTCAAAAQSTDRACFVANNGNLEGSVSSFVFDAAGQPVSVDRIITGVDDEPGTNPQCIAITPSGQFLATGHGTSNDVTEQLTILQVAPDTTLSIAAVFTTPNTPLDLVWYTDELLVVTHSNVGGTNELLLYRWDEAGPSLTLLDAVDTGTFTTYVALHPTLPVVYTQDSWSADRIHAIAINPNDTLTLLQTIDTAPIYPLGMGVSRDGTKLYSTGGISDGRHRVHGYEIAADGTLKAMMNSPFYSPGESPKGVAYSSDGNYLFVTHGTDATVRSFAIDHESGDLTYTTHYFDVGLQGSLGDAEVLDELLLVTDETTAIDGIRGLYAFTINSDGSFTRNGPPVDAGGVTPESIAVWKPADCPPDINGDGLVNSQDFVLFLNLFVAGDPAADFNGDGVIDSQDFIAFLNAFVAGC